MNEIEEFLRRAAAMRAQQAQQRAQPPPQRTPPVAAPPVVYPPQVVDAEIIEAEEVSGDDVAQEVQRHLNTQGFQQRAQHLAENIRAADDAIEAHLHQAFEHRLGQLGTSTSVAEDSTLDDEEAAAAKIQPATEREWSIQSMLRSPNHLRRAIVLREVLDPPEHRW